MWILEWIIVDSNLAYNFFKYAINDLLQRDLELMKEFRPMKLVWFKTCSKDFIHKRMFLHDR